MCGRFAQLSLTDDRYYVVTVDDYTHYMSVYPISTKSAVSECVSDYIVHAERFFHNRGGYRVVTLRSDNGGANQVSIIIYNLHTLIKYTDSSKTRSYL